MSAPRLGFTRLTWMCHFLQATHLDVETRHFIKDLLKYGENGTAAMNPIHAIQRMSLSLVLTLNWGVRMRSQDDALFSEIVHVEEELNHFRGSSASLQDYVLLWRLFPSKPARAIALRNRRDAYILKFDRELRERVKAGTHAPCIQANVMVDPDAQVSEEEVRSISLSMLSAGFETVGATVAWSLGFFAAHPEIQDKAHREISRIYGDDRPLCDPHEDMKCEYVAALVKECLRYFCVVRMNLPRSTIREVEYDGKIIPAGTMVLCNNMACNFGMYISNPHSMNALTDLQTPSCGPTPTSSGQRDGSSILMRRSSHTASGTGCASGRFWQTASCM